jgi:hypothetical protein
MWKAALAGAVALVTIGSVSVTHNGIVTNSAIAQNIVTRDGDIARLKSAQRLTPEPEVRWRPLKSPYTHMLASNIDLLRRTVISPMADTGCLHTR